MVNVSGSSDRRARDSVFICMIVEFETVFESLVIGLIKMDAVSKYTCMFLHISLLLRAEKSITHYNADMKEGAQPNLMDI